MQVPLIFKVHLDQLAVYHNFGQRISEIVSHTGCNRTDSFHFLFVLQLQLQSFALGYIGNHDNDDRGRLTFYRQNFNGNEPIVEFNRCLLTDPNRCSGIILQDIIEP